jgi:glucose/arabinose dehydrogenase
MHQQHYALIAALALGCSGCGDVSRLPANADFGPHPTLVAPRSSVIPTLHIAPASGWPAGVTPDAAAGLVARAYATDLAHPRWLYVLPNGDVLVAETNGPDRPQDNPGIRGWVQKKVQARAGAGVPSANRISLLHDPGDGTAATRTIFIKNLNSPFGMALVGNYLYVADTDALLRFNYQSGDTQITAAGLNVLNLPAGPINHHWTKNVIASPDGKRLYITVGSNSNVGDNGLEQEADRARILEFDPATGNSRTFATGLRNPNGLGWQPTTGVLWTSVNERDELGSDLVPDYITSVKDGGFYGWPFSYYGQHVDTRVRAQRPDLVAQAIVPDYAVGAHTASLGLTFYSATLLPAHYRGGAFVGQHGSWNRQPYSGYKVIFVPFCEGQPCGEPEDILSGFVDSTGHARGRPVGVAVDHSGALLVADDVGNTIWRVTPTMR